MSLIKFNFSSFCYLFGLLLVLGLSFAEENSKEVVEQKIKEIVSQKYHEVFPEDDYKIINISKTDINRIYCPDGITYYQTSAEKYLAISFSETKENEIKRNMFLKIKPKILVNESTAEERFIYNDSPKELYLKCGNNLYTFILKPMNIPARTIYIRSAIPRQDKNNSNNSNISTLNSVNKHVSNKPIKKISLLQKGDRKKALDFEKSMNSYEETLLVIVKSIMKKGFVPGYSEYKNLEFVDKFKQGSLVLSKIFEGPTYRAYLYSFIASQDISKPLREIDFAYLSRKPLAISISDLTLRKGEATSIVIVEAAKNPIIVFKLSDTKEVK